MALCWSWVAECNTLAACRAEAADLGERFNITFRWLKGRRGKIDGHK